MGANAAVGGSLGAGGGALSGVAAGSGGGPIGMIVGGIIGAIIGGVSGGVQGDGVDKAEEQAEKQQAENARNAELTKQANYRQAVSAIAAVAKKGIGSEISKLIELNAKNGETKKAAEQRLKPYNLVKSEGPKPIDTHNVFLGVRNTPGYGKVAKLA